MKGGCVKESSPRRRAPRPPRESAVGINIFYMRFIGIGPVRRFTFLPSLPRGTPSTRRVGLDFFAVFVPPWYTSKNNEIKADS
jgi:hypothetical protein